VAERTRMERKRGLKMEKARVERPEVDEREEAND
jgi:hypothetical protein